MASSCYGREAIATVVEAIAIRLEAIAIRLVGGHGY